MARPELEISKVDDGAAPVETPPRRPRRTPLIIGAIVLAAVIVFFGVRWWQARQFATTDDAQVEGDVIPVLSKVSGYVTAVNVQENTRVRQGDVLATIDPSELQQKLAQAQADLPAAQAAAGGG